MKEGVTYIITLQYTEMSYSRITQEEFTWKEDELFDFVKAKIAEWQSEWRIVDIISITLDLIH